MNYTEKICDLLPSKSGDIENVKEVNIIANIGTIDDCFYFQGSLFLLKMLEEKKKVTVKSISTCGFSCLCGIFFFLNKVDDLGNFLEGIHESITNDEVSITLEDYIETNLDMLLENYHHTDLTKKLIISYYDTKLFKKVIKRKFTSKKDLIDTVIKSCNSTLIKPSMIPNRRFISGMTPYSFEDDLLKSTCAKSIYFNTSDADRGVFKRDSTTITKVSSDDERVKKVIFGVNDLFTFLITKKKTILCKSVPKKSILFYNLEKLALFVQWLLVSFLIIILKLQKYISEKKLWNPLLFKLFLARSFLSTRSPHATFFCRF